MFSLLIISMHFTGAFAQNQEAEIRQRIEEYIKVFSLEDLSKSLDYTYPKLFKMVPRETLEQVMEGTFNDPEIKISMKDLKAGKISSIIEYNAIEYALIDYSYTMSVYIAENQEEAKEDTEEASDADMFQTMEDMYKAMYGDDKVITDLSKRTISIKVSTKMLAIKDPEYNDWYFLEYKKDNTELLSKLIPKKVISILNKI